MNFCKISNKITTIFMYVFKIQQSTFSYIFNSNFFHLQIFISSFCVMSAETTIKRLTYRL